MKKFLALLIVCTIALSLTACGGKPVENETTTEEITTVLAEDTAIAEPETDAPEENGAAEAPTELTTEAPTEAPTEGEVTTAAEETTTEAVALTAPVGGDIAEIVSYYNETANATKAYKDKFTVTKKQILNAEITELSVGFLRKVASDLVSKFIGKEKVYEDTFTNGKGANGNDIKKFLWIEGDTAMSRLPASGVQSATCTAEGNTYKIKMRLKPETVGCNEMPPNHTKVMDYLEIEDSDLGPIDMIKDKTTFTYTGATVEATVGENGLLSYVRFYEPVVIDGTFKMGASADATISGNWEQIIRFKY